MSLSPDFPQDKKDGTGFVTLVLFLMVTLATLMVGVTAALYDLRQRFVADMDGQATIEIPATDAAGQPRSRDHQLALADSMAQNLSTHPDILVIQQIEEADIRTLIGPWLGEATNLNDLPMPVMLAVTLPGPATQDLRAAIAGIDPAATLDLHEDWARDVRHMTGLILMTTLAMALAVIACCIMTVIGAVQSRLATNADEITLLHGMGATDPYISRQFVAQVAGSSATAAFMGAVLAAGLLYGAYTAAGQSGLIDTSGPNNTGHFYMAWLLAVPVAITLLSILAARITVLRTLRRMA